MQQSVGLGSLFVRLKVIRLFVIADVYLGLVDELLNVQGVSFFFVGFFKILARKYNVITLLILISFDDFVPRNLFAVPATDTSVTDAGFVLGMQQIKIQTLPGFRTAV